MVDSWKNGFAKISNCFWWIGSMPTKQRKTNLSQLPARFLPLLKLQGSEMCMRVRCQEEYMGKLNLGRRHETAWAGKLGQLHRMLNCPCNYSVRPLGTHWFPGVSYRKFFPYSALMRLGIFLQKSHWKLRNRYTKWFSYPLLWIYSKEVNSAWETCTPILTNQYMESTYVSISMWTKKMR